MRKKFIKLFFLVLLGNFCIAQELPEKELRDNATEKIADVVFNSKAKQVRDRTKAFENACDIKIQFRVEDQSLDRLGGLSEHLFKLFQNFTTTENVNAKTITGEFSALKNNVFVDTLSYKTNVTPDLSACVLPLKDTQKLDSAYNKSLSGNLFGADGINQVPQSTNEIYSTFADDYEKTLFKNASCTSVYDVNAYNQHVINTRGSRYTKWTDDAAAFSLGISGNYSQLVGENTGPVNTNNGTTSVDAHINPSDFSGRYIFDSNNSVNPCTEQDMEVRCRMLFNKTTIRFLFVTHDIDYYLPADSINKFCDAATQAFNTNQTDNIIIALYLKMKDASTDVNTGIVLVKQFNGSWLTKADIAFSNFNNGGNYTAATFHKFKNLFKNIPKPLVLCYQVAKVNGALTTTYFYKGDSIKGREQMYYHVFKLDKAFEEIKQLDNQLQDAYLLPSNMQGNYKAELIDDIRNKIKIAYLKAAKNPSFNEAEVHFREIYLQKKDIAQAAALKYVSDHYGLLYKNNQFSQVINNAGLSDAIYVGSCTEGGGSDVIADALNVTSLLLSPFGLDLIPDALSVVYFAATDQTLNMFLASASFLIPGNLCAAKSILSTSTDAVKAINKGSKLLIESGQLKAIEQDINYITGMFHINPADVDAALVSKINSNPSITNDLLSVTGEKVKLFSNTEKLDEPKRAEFIRKCFDDEVFKNKCLTDPEEVLRWGGFALGTKIDRVVTNILKNENLPNWIKESYKDSKYLTVETNKKVTLFRDFGDQAFMDGSFSTTINNASRNDLALHTSFNNNMRFKSTIEVPSGETLNIGKVGPYPPGDLNALPGGADQILLPENYSHSWIKEIIDTQTGQIYSVTDFKQIFPNLVKNQ